MQVQHVGCHIRGFTWFTSLGDLWDMTPKDAKQRLKILQFWKKHGLAVTINAFEVSRRTIYRWRKQIVDAGANPAVLAAKSCAPKRRRTSKTDPGLMAEIRRLRMAYPHIGKDKLAVMLMPWCQAQGVPRPPL